jgi:Zn-dependent M28 family amino/carboxypeptidase
MKTFNEELWQAGKQSLRKMILWFVIIVGIGLFGVTLLSFWITQPVFLVSRKNADQISVSAKRLEVHVKKLSQDYVPRSASFPQNLDKVANYIEQEFQNAGGKTFEQNFEVESRNYRNVIAQFGAETKDKIVVGAHYDAAGVYPAADDNASGVAGLIELAHLLGQTELPTQVELVAYTLEEPPFFGTKQMGSFIHANLLKKNNVSVRLMIALEMIGYFSDQPSSQKYPVSLLSLLYPSKGNFIVIVGNLYNSLTVRRIKSVLLSANDLPICSINAPSFINGVDFSDHRNYWHFGYNAVMVTDTAFYRNFNYHTSADTAEKLDYNRMSQVVDGVYQTIVEVAK